MNLEEERQEIDKIDAELVKNLKNRLQILQKIAIIKRENELPIHDSKRVSEKISNLTKEFEIKEEKDFISNVFSSIIRESEKYERGYYYGRDEHSSS